MSRQLHAEGVLLKNRPSYPAPQGRDVRWHSPKGEHPHQGRTRGTPTWHWDRNGLSVAPIDMADWGNTTRDDRLVKTTRGGPNHPSWRERCWSQVSLTIRSPPSATPGWGGALSSRHHCGRWPPAPTDANIIPTTATIQRSRALPLHALDWIEWYARYVQMPSWWKELTKIPDHTGHQEFSQKVCASFQVPKVWNWAKKVNNYHTQLPAHPSISKHHFLLPRDVRFGTQDIHLTQLHHNITYARVLWHWAEEVHPQPTLSPGKECNRTLVGNGAAHHFHKERCVHDHGTIQMDGNNLAMVDGGHATRIPEEPHPKQQVPPKRVHVHILQWRLACYYCQAGHCNSRSTSNSTLRVYASPACIWLQAPVPAVWVCGDSPDPKVGRAHGEHPTASHHQHSIWRDHRPLCSHGDSCDGDQTTLKSDHQRSVSRHPGLFQRDCGPGTWPSGG